VSAGKPLNISVRAQVETGADVLISGFINFGTAAKKVILRALGPSLQQSGVTDALADPILELHAGDGTLITTNNNWKDNTALEQQDITSNQLAPTNDLESAIVSTLQPGNYTAIVTGKNGTTGVGLLEFYSLR